MYGFARFYLVQTLKNIPNPNVHIGQYVLGQRLSKKRVTVTMKQLTLQSDLSLSLSHLLYLL